MLRSLSHQVIRSVVRGLIHHAKSAHSWHHGLPPSFLGVIGERTSCPCPNGGHQINANRVVMRRIANCHEAF